MLKESISEIIWDTKYRYRFNGHIIDRTLEDTWRRVATAVAQAEPAAERARWSKAYYQILERFQYLPGGRILAGAGTEYPVTLFNCFVMDIAADSLPCIFDALKEGVLTLQQGGGVGYDFSVIRPAGDLVRRTGSTASGPISFMRVWDAACSTMLATGARRGAMMGVLRCDHPDIEAFIAAKADHTQLRHFNVSVLVSDAFMQAVRDDAPWALVFPLMANETTDNEVIFRQWGTERAPVPCKVYRYINARALWHNIIRAAHSYAEPGVLFIDTINRTNNLFYRETIHATNPCGEIPLPAYGACNLGAVNLTQFVISPFTERATINWAALDEVVSVATRFQDAVIDVSLYPLAKQREQAFGSRRIGLGLTGLADAFVMMGLRYGSSESVTLAGAIMQRIAEVTWRTSIELAKEKGVFPFYEPAYLQGQFVQTLDDSIRQDLQKYGVRNSHHNTIAPTGTTSLLANNVSNGIEPIFKAEYVRHMQMSGQEIKTFRVQDYAQRAWRETHGVAPYAPGWVDTDTLTPEAHLAIQGAVQPYIDNAISKTINLPESFPLEKLEHVYTKAYELGLKGCTVFRPNPVTGSVLEAATQQQEPPADQCCSFES